MKSIVTARGVSFELPNGRNIFTNLNFTLEPKITALVGPNGIGKTCLAQLLAGSLEPSQGVIRRQSSISFFPQRQEAPKITIDEFLALDYEWSPLIEKLLSGLNRQTLCSNLSGGQWMRVRLAHTLGSQFLILDEPTNDLDRESRNALLEFLREFQSGVLLISHDRECLQLCEEVLELSNQGLSRFGGSWSQYEEAKEDERKNLRSALELAKQNRDASHEKRSSELSRQEKRNRQGAKSAAKGGLPKILLGARKRKAQATTAKIDTATLARSEEAVHEAYEAFSKLKLDPVMYADLIGHEIPQQKLVAEASDFNIRFDDWVYGENLNFSWRGNVRVALRGPNGSGKSTLLKAIQGAGYQTRGALRSGKLKTLYIDQSCSVLDDSKNIFESIQEVTVASESEIRNGLAKFLFTKEAVFQKVHSLSGGERLRAALARGFLSADKPELLILDEPTNNLDFANIEFLENLVRGFRGALLVISHDEVFLENCELQIALEL